MVNLTSAELRGELMLEITTHILYWKELETNLDSVLTKMKCIFNFFQKRKALETFKFNLKLYLSYKIQIHIVDLKKLRLSPIRPGGGGVQTPR